MSQLNNEQNLRNELSVIRTSFTKVDQEGRATMKRTIDPSFLETEDSS